MDKSLILAVAGSGKTTFIVSKLDLENRHLIVTYTRENIRNLRNGIIKKFGYFPANIKLYSFFGFLYSFCYKPFLGRIDNPKGLFWDFPPEYTRRIPERARPHFFLRDRRIFHNRLSKYLIRKDLLAKINSRIEKYYEHFHIDEIQDFGGYDFEVLMSFAQLNVNLTWVGDFYQHTFDTSRDGNRNSNLHSEYEGYKTRFINAGLQLTESILSKSWRCSMTICNFIKDSLGITIETNKIEDTSVRHLDDKAQIEELFSNDSVIKLFYQAHYKYPCYSKNWGECKGANHFHDVCVVLNKTTFNLFNKGNLKNLAPLTRNKLYVACSRANGNLYLISEESIKHLRN